MAITNKQKEQFVELRADGMSFDSISKQLSISKPTLIKLNSELDKEISNAEYLKIEALVEMHKLSKNAKIVSFLKQLEKINAEIEKRDLSKVSFKDLLIAKKSLEINLKVEFENISYATGEFSSNLDFDLTKEIILSLD
jgi:orotate phosphoribosyltransferase-like protein